MGGRQGAPPDVRHPAGGPDAGPPPGSGGWRGPPHSPAQYRTLIAARPRSRACKRLRGRRRRSPAQGEGWASARPLRTRSTRVAVLRSTDKARRSAGRAGERRAATRAPPCSARVLAACSAARLVSAALTNHSSSEQAAYRRSRSRGAAPRCCGPAPPAPRDGLVSEGSPIKTACNRAFPCRPLLPPPSRHPLSWGFAAQPGSRPWRPGAAPRCCWQSPSWPCWCWQSELGGLWQGWAARGSGQCTPQPHPVLHTPPAACSVADACNRCRKKKVRRGCGGACACIAAGGGGRCQLAAATGAHSWQLCCHAHPDAHLHHPPPCLSSGGSPARPARLATT